MSIIKKLNTKISESYFGNVGDICTGYNEILFASCCISPDTNNEITIIKDLIIRDDIFWPNWSHSTYLIIDRRGTVCTYGNNS